MNDYRRPADYQVRNVYRCETCKKEVEVESCYAGPTNCICGGFYEHAGETYPANSEDWHEERDNVNDDWRNSNNRY